MTGKPNVGIRFPTKLLEEVDKIAGLRGKTRSEIVLDFVRLGLGITPNDGLAGVIQRLAEIDDRLTAVEQKLDSSAKPHHEITGEAVADFINDDGSDVGRKQRVIIKQSRTEPAYCPVCGEKGQNKGVRNGVRRWYCPKHGTWNTPLDK